MADTTMSILGNDAHDDIKDFAFTYAAYDNARAMQNRATSRQKELNTQMANLARQNRQSAAYDEVQGMIKAGMSPTLAGGGSFSPAGTSSSGPLPQPALPNLSHSQMAKLVLEQKELDWQQKRWQDAEMDLIKSQAEKNRAEASKSGAEEENVRSQTNMNDYVMKLWTTRDESIAASAKKFAEAVANDKNASDMDKAIAKTFADCSNPDSGTLEGISKFLDSVEKHHEIVADVLANDLRAAVANGQIKNEDTLEALRRMPEAQFNELTATAGELVSQMYLNQSKKNLTDEDVKKTRQLIVNYTKEADKLDAEVAKIKAERKAIVHGDIIQSMEEDPGATILRETYDFGKDAAQFYIGGRGLGKAAQTLQPKPLTTKPQPIDIKFDEQWRYNKNGQPTSHKRSEMRRLAE